MEEISPLQKERLSYQPTIPKVLGDLKRVCLKPVQKRSTPKEILRKLFPRTFDQTAYQIEEAIAKEPEQLTVGLFFSGGPAAGGHNVIAGLFDALHKVAKRAKIIGFLNGPAGIVENKWIEITKKQLDGYRNLGGFDLIGSGRVKIETAEQLASSLKSAEEHQLDGLIVIGGDDSNTNAALLAEYFLAQECSTRVIGIPKTIDGDLRSEDIEISFGFDSACKTYAELIGNIARDAVSSRKYYHFIKLMGRSASHIALECALATRPNLTLIGEERKPLKQIVSEIADLIIRRAAIGKEYGVILVPEGLIEFVPEIQSLIKEINANQLTIEGKSLLDSLPEKIQRQLMLERDPHGNVQVSLIETEQLLIDLVKQEMKQRGASGKFRAFNHFLGYEGRACLPSNFDSNYCYTLGLLAALAIRDALTGMICSVQNLKSSAEEWKMKMIPLVQLMHLEERHGKEKPVIAKAVVDMNQETFIYFARLRKSWELEDSYRYPGPIQFFGSSELIDSVPRSLGK